MTDTEDPVLAGLQAEHAKVSAQAKSIMDNDNASTADLLRAVKLVDRADQIKADLGKAVKAAEEAEAKRYAAEPQRGLPFPGAQPDKGRTRIDTGKSEVDKLEATGGFKNIGHFAWAQLKQGRHRDGDPGAVEMMRKWQGLQLKAPSGMFEQSDPDGGDLIPREFSNQIYERMVAKNQILDKLSPIPVTGNTMTLPKLRENSRADGSRGGGILGYWDGEAGQYTSSKSRLSTINLRLHKLTVLTYLTEELMNDSPVAIQSWIMKKAPDEINFKINDAVINGTGVGMPMGIMGSGSKITVTAVSGQGAGSFVYQNTTDMFARVVAGQRSSLIWLYNQDVESQLSRLYMSTGSAAGVAIFTPNKENNGFSLQGRPALVMEQCQTAGTAGDVIAFATDGYACITKGGIENFMSMHLRFDYDEVAFKWRFRFDGQPYDDVALTPYKGSNTVSSIVVLNSTRT